MTDVGGNLYSGGETVNLPPLVCDGIEHARREALRPLAYQYLAELEIADEQSAALRNAPDRPRLADMTGDFADYSAALAVWDSAHPDPLSDLNHQWRQRLDIQDTNNMYLVFARYGHQQALTDGNLHQRCLDLLSSADKRFVTAAQTAAARYHQSNLSRVAKGRAALHGESDDISVDEQAEYQLDEWICHGYTTEAAARLCRLGVDEHEIKRLGR